MPGQDYIYQNRAVAFVDVLGFRQKLLEFEKDAKLKKVDEGDEYLVSEKVNEFICTFKEVTSLLEKENYKYYLFSDNICITIDYIENPNLLVSLLLIISELFFSFAQKGYFLRGGIHLGKFVDEDKIALGNPLVIAYEMESKEAVYPRILISDPYMEILRNYQQSDQLTEYRNLNLEHLTRQSCQLSFLNVFFNVIRKEDKAGFFQAFQTKITENLKSSNNKEDIHIKYRWLADQFNQFLDLYTNDLIYRQEQFEPDEEQIADLQKLKISMDGL